MTSVQCAICMHDQVNALRIEALNMLKGLLGFKWQLSIFSEISPIMDLEGYFGNSESASKLKCPDRFENIMNALHLSF